MLYRTLELTLGPALRTVYRPTVTGVEHVPETGPVIFAANHNSVADQVFIPLAAHRQVFWFAKSEYFTQTGLRGSVIAAFFRAMGQVPVARQDARAAAAVIEVGLEVLAQDRALGIFPEGTRSPDGRIHKFRTGLARTALRSGAPVVPVGVVGTREVHVPGSSRWHRAHVEIHFGTPLRFDHLAAQERSSRVLREVTEQVRMAVQELSGTQYVDTYGSAVKLAG